MDRILENTTDQQPDSNSPEAQKPEQQKPEPKPESKPAPKPPQQPPEQGVAVAADKPAKVKRGAGLAVALLALLIAILAAAGSAYLWQLDVKQQQLLEKDQAEIASALQRVDQQVDDNRILERRFSQLDQQTTSGLRQQQLLQQQIDELTRQLNSQQKRLLSLSTTDRADWLLAEAEYLMRLANQRLLMGKEVKGALELLKAADAILVELDDSGLFALRRVLAEDMAALWAAGSLDIAGIYLQLAAVANQAQQLKLIEMPQLQVAPVEAQPDQDWQQRMQAGLNAAWQKLAQYIQIKRRDEIYKPLLAPEYEAAVRQNVGVMFEQAQLAALSGQQRIYQASLAKAKHWLEMYYTLDQASTAAVLSRIDDLAQQQIALTLPDISGSLRTLKNYLQSIHKVNSISNLPAKSGAGTTNSTTKGQGRSAVANDQDLRVEEPAQ